MEPGGHVGTLDSLNRRFRLVLPEDVSGTVIITAAEDRRVAVDYGQPLLELRREVGEETADRDADRAPSEETERLGPGLWPVVSPTDGVFYRCPSPEAAPFVEPGSRVRAGQPVGLVESMKTFNQILYGGPGFPEDGEVVEIRCEDTHEVRTGQVLMVVRSADAAGSGTE